MAVMSKSWTTLEKTIAYASNSLAILISLINICDKSSVTLAVANYLLSISFFITLPHPIDYTDEARGPYQIASLLCVFLMITIVLAMGLMLLP